MRTIISILLFLFAFKSEGQIINASQPYRPFTAASSCSYLLDTYSGAAAAYSLRKLDCDYSGYAIRVRLSTNNAEQDIGFTSAGDLDTASLKSFIGSNSGYVVTWYDQLGNINAVTSGTVYQPIIVDAGVVKRENQRPSLYFNGGAYMTVKTSINQPNSTFLVGKNNGTNDRHFIDATTSRQIVGVNSNNLIAYAGSVLSFGANSTAFNIYTAIYNGASSLIARNGSSVSGNAGTAGIDNILIGRGFGGLEYLTGSISEIIFFSSNKSSDRVNIESSINTYYSIY